MSKIRFGPHNPAATYVSHAFAEKTIDTGEAVINYAVAGAPDKPALLLIPGQMESWWGYETSMGLLQEHFQAFAIDLRGQGRSRGLPVATPSTTSATTWCGSSRSQYGDP